jgi:hypothetical protein
LRVLTLHYFFGKVGDRALEFQLDPNLPVWMREALMAKIVPAVSDDLDNCIAV